METTGYCDTCKEKVILTEDMCCPKCGTSSDNMPIVNEEYNYGSYPMGPDFPFNF